MLVFAADINSPNADAPIGYIDHLPISDQLANLHGVALDLVLVTRGGAGETAEEIVRIIRDKYEHVAVIVPGWAKSAGTIITMAADEILMGPTSALGPIDAQLFWQGKQFSAEALLEGLNKIKADVDKTGVLNNTAVQISWAEQRRLLKTREKASPKGCSGDQVAALDKIEIMLLSQLGLHSRQ